MRPSTLALKAYNLLKRCGWVQGYYHVPQGYCLLGALGHTLDAHNPDHWASGAYHAVETAIIDHIGNPSKDLARLQNWNDAPGRTKQEVLNLLKQVATDLASKGL